MYPDFYSALLQTLLFTSGMNFLKILFSFFLFLLVQGRGYSQQFIKGKICDEQLAGLAFSTVTLHASDSSVLQSVSSDSSGFFLIKIPEGGKAFFLEIEGLGFGRKRISIPLSKTDTIEISVQLKTANNELKAVDIFSRNALIQRKAERIIFNAENSIAAIGSDAFELLKKVPGFRSAIM